MAHTDRGQGVVRARIDEVYAALIDPKARTVWLPPAGMRGEIERFDARPGGGYRMRLIYEDRDAVGKTGADHDLVEARFVAMDGTSRVVEEVDFVSDDPRYAGTMTMAWELTDDGPETVVAILASNVPDGIDRSDHETAFASTLANLDRYLRDVERDH